MFKYDSQTFLPFCRSAIQGSNASRNLLQAPSGSGSSRYYCHVNGQSSPPYADGCTSPNSASYCDRSSFSTATGDACATSCLNDSSCWTAVYNPDDRSGNTCCQMSAKSPPDKYYVVNGRIQTFVIYGGTSGVTTPCRSIQSNVVDQCP